MEKIYIKVGDKTYWYYKEEYEKMIRFQSKL